MYEDKQVGAMGQAERINVVPTPLSAAGVDTWLITSPSYHPLWAQYMLYVVTLRDDIPGLGEAKRRFPEATHEMIVMALNPDAEGYPYNKESVEDLFNVQLRGVPYLTPVNHALQFASDDEEMRKLAWWACYGIINGVLNPETGDAPITIRAAWNRSLSDTLNHIRGGHE